MKSVISEKIIGDNELYPIYGIVGKPFWQSKIFLGILIAIAVLVFVLIVTFLVKRFKNRGKKEFYWQRALRELANLKNLILQDKISHKNFYLILTDIVKKYLFDRFGYDLFGLTDHELIKFLENKNFDACLLENIKNMFLSMEVVKFANAHTVRELMEQDLLRCTELVSRTLVKK